MKYTHHIKSRNRIIRRRGMLIMIAKLKNSLDSTMLPFLILTYTLQHTGADSRYIQTQVH